MNSILIGVGSIIGFVAVLGISILALRTLLLFILDPIRTTRDLKWLFDEWVDNWKKFLHKDKNND